MRNIKKNKSKILSIFLLFLICFSFVFAQPPFQESLASDDEAVVIFPKTEYFPHNENISLHFHIINSTGKQLNNTEFDCNIHLYNNKNNHVLVTDLLSDSNGIDKYIDLNTTYTNKQQIYTYLVSCNTTEGEYGYISNSFEITKEGKNPQRVLFSIPAVILLLTFLYGLIKITFSIDSEEHMNIRLFLVLCINILLIIITKTSLSIVQSLNTTSIIINSFITLYRFSLVIFYMFFAYIVLLYFIPKIFEFINEKIIKK